MYVCVCVCVWVCVCVCVCFRRQVEYVTYYSAVFTSISNPGHVTRYYVLKKFHVAIHYRN